jgi:hypothetical protein
MLVLLSDMERPVLAERRPRANRLALMSGIRMGIHAPLRILGLGKLGPERQLGLIVFTVCF